MSGLRRLLAYVRPYTGRFLLAVAASIFVAGFTVLLAMSVKPLIDHDLRPEGLGHAPDIPDALGGVPTVLLIVIAFVGKGLCSYVSRYLMSWVGERSVVDLRTEVGAAITQQSVAYFTDRPAGEFVTRITADPDKVLLAMSEKLYDLIKEPITMIALGSWLFWLEWKLAVVALLVAPILIIPVSRVGRKLRRAGERSQQSMADLASRVSEVVRSIRVVKAATAEGLEAERIGAAAKGIFTANMRAVKVVALTPPLMELLAGFAIAAAFWYGKKQIEAQNMTPGDFMSFMAALFMLYTPAKKLTRVQAAFEQALAAADRCFKVIDDAIDVTDRPGATDVEAVKGEVRFDDVAFRYQDQWVLRELDFAIPAGSVVALVGHSGSGKSTVANLILRFYDPTEGRITLDGRDLRAVTLKSLRRSIGLVPQDVVLFNDTLAANIAYGLGAVEPERIAAAARAAYAEEFIKDLPAGYETIVGEGGSRLSTGQRQRIAIAHALLKDPPLLILDEATSALDSQSEALVVRALNNLMSTRTTLVIAHRLSTVRRADRILVLDQGQLRESGTHDELMCKKGGLYNRLAELQASGELLE